MSDEHIVFHIYQCFPCVQTLLAQKRGRYKCSQCGGRTIYTGMASAPPGEHPSLTPRT